MQIMFDSRRGEVRGFADEIWLVGLVRYHCLQNTFGFVLIGFVE